MTFGEKLFNLRKSLNYSQEELAEKLGVTRQAISRWENGETMPDSPNLLEICNLFDVSADYLLRENGELKTPEPEISEKGNPYKNKLFIIYIFVVLAMSVLLYLIAFADLDIFYWLAGTAFLAVGIFTLIAYLKGKISDTSKNPLYLAASILFLISGTIGVFSGMNIFLLFGFLCFLIGIILLLIYILK